MKTSFPFSIEWQMPQAAWDEAVTRCPGATFFHTDAWLRVMAASFGSRPQRVRFLWPDGRWALVPLSIRPLAKGCWRLAFAGETGVYGGLLSPDAFRPEETAAMLAGLRRHHPDLRLTGNPFAPAALAPHESPLLSGGGRLEAQATHLLSLAPLESLRANFSRGCKARGNKARRQGLRLVMSHEPQSAAVFYNLYLDSMRRWGAKLTWPRPAQFFESLLREGGSHSRLFLACTDETPIAGLLFVEFGGIAHYLAGATDEAHLALAPSNWLMEEAMAHYAGKGCHTFDFGPSNGLEGVIQFKESFGARPVTFQALHFHTAVGRAYFALRDAWPPKRAAAPPTARAPVPADAHA